MKPDILTYYRQRVLHRVLNRSIKKGSRRFRRIIFIRMSMLSRDGQMS